jgi:hypothetical protein
MRQNMAVLFDKGQKCQILENTQHCVYTHRGSSRGAGWKYKFIFAVLANMSREHGATISTEDHDFFLSLEEDTPPPPPQHILLKPHSERRKSRNF